MTELLLVIQFFDAMEYKTSLNVCSIFLFSAESFLVLPPVISYLANKQFDQISAGSINILLLGFVVELWVFLTMKQRYET